MAELLYRLGTFAARRAWTVIVAWIGILAIAGIGFAIGFKGLATSFDIPGTASGEVTEELQERLPDFSGASGTVVFETTDGSELTADQRAAISDLVASGDDLPDVATLVDPFEADAERAAREQELADGAQQLDDGRAQLDAGQAQLDAATAQLDAGQAQLDAARQQAESAGAPAAALAPLDAQQAQLDAGRAELAAQQATLDASRDELESGAAQLEQGEELLGLAAGIGVVSEDGSTALVNVAFTEPRLELPEESKQAVIEHFESESIEGVEVSFSTDIAQGVPSLIGIGEIVGVIFAAVVLLVMLGSILAASLPIMTALVGVAIAALGSLAFSGVVQMASVTPILGVMLGLAVGIDYSLFIINRHRKQLLEGADVHESVGLANGTAGNAVVFAGTTVIVALLALNVTGVPFLGLMGTVGAIGVAIAVLIAVSLTPALLGLIGVRVLGTRARARIGEVHHEDTKAKPMSTWRAVVTVLATAAALLTIAIPALSMRVGLPDGSSEPHESASYQAFATTEAAFGAGATGPLLVTAALPEGLDDDAVLETQLEVAQTIFDQEHVTAVAPIAVSDDHRLAAFQVVPTEGPNSPSTEQLVRDLRDLPAIDGDITLGVAGQASINIDISENLLDVLPLYLAVVVGLSLLIMILVFRSILVPLIATGGFILSLFATYGATVALFQWGWLAEPLGIQTGPILSFLPVILVGILFGLAMDYQLFLASGMREAYVHGAPARLAVVRGFRAGRSVVIAAGLIMISVFGGFIFAESTMIRSIGFGLAFGVLVDAFVVRMLLMPAVMHLLGRSAWWIPRWLDRIMPNVDVEGAALERRHHATPVAEREPAATH
ncbi:MMPL family transporter [Agromyces aerolatus]|uniref:MMPL family transporter n=1 Tax=Agromyces sp. LY-1074 TaxID=3074080 RepID=UPI0028675836|nr:MULTISPECIES: MMPL family transporter [unclassified Agromyces]MDR5699176.1 MMPL family transporter [Agromyces sp. LY-1074]MDR5705471.1 MMPL family transporter [Agromyces sp. LY-1358]